jgi:hypothetical protein
MQLIHKRTQIRGGRVLMSTKTGMKRVKKRERAGEKGEEKITKT